MTYTPQVWVDKITDLDVAHMTHIEDGIFAALPKAAGAADPITGTIYATGVDGSGVGLYMSGLLNITRAAAGQLLMQGWVGGEANPRFQVVDDGTVRWGPGNTATDANLYRSAGNQLTTDGTLVVRGLVYSQSEYIVAAHTRPEQFVIGDIALWAPGGAHVPGLVFGSGGDTLLYRSAAQALTTPGSLSTGGATTTLGSSSAGPGTYQGPGGTFASVRSAVGVSFSASIMGDPGTYRFMVDTTGKLNWADGTAASPDTNLYRMGAGYLRTDQNFVSSKGIWVDYGDTGQKLFWGSAADTNLYRSGAGLLKTDGSLVVNLGLTIQGGADPSLLIGYVGNRVFQIRNTGKHEWGPGGTDAVDTNLYRAGAGILKTDGVFQVGSWFAAQIGGATQTIVGDLSPFVGGSARSGIIFGSANDTNLYRTATNTLKTDGTLEVGVGVKFPDATVQTTAAVAGAAPTGTITMFGGTVAPSGWQLCDGSSLLRSSFAALFAVIGTTYGSVDGTHFTVPDMRGRVPVGVNGGGPGAVNALGLSDGVAVASRRPQHRHTAHSHGSASGRQFAVGGAGAGNLNSAGAGTYDTATDAKDGGSANAADALDAPAYLVINYMIKT